MTAREKYIEVLSKTAKTVKEFNVDAPIRISLECVEDILELLKEQEAKQVELHGSMRARMGNGIRRIGEVEMTREEIIRSFKRCREARDCRSCEDCKYGGRSFMTCERLADDILSLLKEQEAREKNRLPYSPDSNVQWT